ncbi:MAG: hypothetical protein QOF15_1746 [Mycobacterium sp.]|nr:hypothetical protein [Mycobacterium sp.]
MTAVVAITVSAAPAAPATAATPSWSGKYSLVRYAVNKTGTSVAASQAEPTFSADYVFSTVCSAASCVATANNGPTPKNPTISVPSHYTWDGAKWVERFDFQWDCYLGEGVPKAWAPAKSWAFYTPQSGGSLRGTWHTDILSGPCEGSVEMPVAAVRAGS